MTALEAVDFRFFQDLSLVFVGSDVAFFAVGVQALAVTPNVLRPSVIPQVRFISHVVCLAYTILNGFGMFWNLYGRQASTTVSFVRRNMVTSLLMVVAMLVTGWAVSANGAWSPENLDAATLLVQVTAYYCIFKTVVFAYALGRAFGVFGGAPAPAPAPAPQSTPDPEDVPVQGKDVTEDVPVKSNELFMT